MTSPKGSGKGTKVKKSARRKPATGSRRQPKARQGRLLKDTDPEITRLAETYHDRMSERVAAGALESKARRALHKKMRAKKIERCPVELNGKEFLAVRKPGDEKVFVQPVKEKASSGKE